MHAAQLLRTLKGDFVEIDCGIVKLIQLLWRLGLKTLYSCEDQRGCVEIATPDTETALRFWALVDTHHTLVEEARYRRFLDEFQQMFPVDGALWQELVPYELSHGGTVGQSCLPLRTLAERWAGSITEGAAGSPPEPLPAQRQKCPLLRIERRRRILDRQCILALFPKEFTRISTECSQKCSKPPTRPTIGPKQRLLGRNDSLTFPR